MPADADSSPPPTQREIARLWLPLAASWALMTTEYPIIQASIARLPDLDVMLAAASLVIGLQITIESPVIMLLATTTALARSPQAYRTLRRFVFHVNVLVTVVAAVVAFVGPVWEALVPGLMGIPDPVARAALPAMRVMTLWSAAIGWRRFHQGILIRAGRTRLVGWGTAVRLVCAGGSALVLPHTTDLPGVMIGAWAWMAGVVAEAVFAHVVARATIRERYLDVPDVPGRGVSYGEVLRFHAPLAGTSLLSLMAMPLVQAGLSRMPMPVENLAAWPVAFAVLLLFRSPGFAFPEVVIARLDGPSFAPLRRFGWWIAALSSGALLTFAVSPLFDLYLSGALRVPPRLSAWVAPAVVAGLGIPALQVLESWYRGVLMQRGATVHVTVGMAINLATTAALLWLAVRWSGPGIAAAAAAIAVAMLVEVVYLSRSTAAQR